MAKRGGARRVEGGGTRGRASRPVSPSTELPHEDIDSNKEVFRNLLGRDVDRSLEERGIRKGVTVKLFVRSDDNFFLAGSAKLGTAGDANSLVQRQLHLHELPQTPREDLVVITGCNIACYLSSFPYPYTFEGGEGPPASLGEMHPAGFYAWDTRMMIPRSTSGDATKKRDALPQAAGPSNPSGSTQVPVVSPPPRKRMKTNVFKSASEDAPKTTPAFVPKVVASEEGSVVEVTANNFADSGRPIAPRMDDLNAYHTVEIWMHFKQLIVPPRTLRVVSKPHAQKDLKPLFKMHGMDYSQGFMTVTIRREDNKDLEDLKLFKLLEDREDQDYEGNKVVSRHLRVQLKAMVVDGLHRKSILSDVESFPWIKDPIRIHLMLRKDGKDMTVTEILKQSSKKNRVSSAVRPFKGLEAHIHAALSYLRSFASENDVNPEEVRPVDLMEELFAAKFFPELEKPSYSRYSRIAKLFARHPRAYALFSDLKPEEKPIIGVVHLDHSTMFQVDEQGVLLFLKSLDKYVRNPASDGKFLPTPFYQCAMDLYRKTRSLFSTYGRTSQLSFQEFLNVEISLPRGHTITIEDYFANQMRLFSGKSRQAQQRNKNRADRFVSKISSHFDELLAAKAADQVPKDINVLPSDKATDQISAPATPSEQPQANKHASASASSKQRKLTGQPSRRTQPSRQRRAPSPLRITTPSVRRNDPGRKPPKKKSANLFQPSHCHDLDDELDSEGYRIPAPDSTDDSFDDKVPDLLPVGYEKPPVFKGALHPWWQQALGASPSVAETIIQAAKSKDVDVEQHTAPLLSALHVGERHRANLYMKASEVFFAYRMAWLLAEKQKLELDRKSNASMAEHLPSDDWDTAATRFRSGEAASYFATKREHLNERGFCVLERFADDSDVPDHVRNRLDPPQDVRRASVQDICDHYLATFPGEGALKDENNRKLWNPIVNVGEEEGDREHRADGKARYTSTRALLMSESERKPETLWASIARASLDVWLGQLAVLLGLTNNGEEKMWIPNTGGRFLITGTNCPRQAAHNDFQVPHRSHKDKLPGYFIMVNGKDPFPLWFCDYSHHFVFNPLEQLCRFGDCLQLRKIIVPARSVFFGHGYATHAGAGYESRVLDQTTTRYHIYLVPESKNLPNSVFYSFGVQPRFHDKSIPTSVEEGANTSLRHTPDVVDSPPRPVSESSDLENLTANNSADDDDQCFFNNSEDSDA